MNNDLVLTLVNCITSAPLERVRGGNIVLQLECEWTLFDSKGEAVRTLTCPGFAQTTDANLSAHVLEGLFTEAVEWSRNMVIARFVNTELEKDIISGTRAKEVQKALLTRRQDIVRDKLIETLGNETQLTQPATTIHQKTVNELCEVLGISRILIEGYTVLEAGAAITELQHLTKRLTKVTD